MTRHGIKLPAGQDLGWLSPRVCNTLRMVTRAVTQLYDDVLRPSDVRVTQFSILAAIGRIGEASLKELGGSDPFIVLADADLAAAARTAAEARLINSGQSCIAAKRFIVVEPVADQFLDRFLDELRSRRMGDPLVRGTQVGPQARLDLRDSLHEQVAESVKRGAKLLLGGEVPAGKGAFYPPTLLAAVDKGMPAFDEETFGPVAAVIRAKDEAGAFASPTTRPLVSAPRSGRRIARAPSVWRRRPRQARCS